LAEKPFDINAFIEQSKAARAESLKKKEAAEKAAAQKKADTKTARGIQNQANNKFQYAESLGNSLKDFEGQLRIFGTKIARGDKLDALEKKEFDRVTKEYKKLSTAYTAALAEGNKILAKMPESFAKEKKETEEKAGIVEEPAAEEAPQVGLTDFLKDVIGDPGKIRKLQQALKDIKAYDGPVNGIFNDALVNAAAKAEARLDVYAGLDIVFTDRFEGYKRLASGDTGTGTGTGGAGEPPITEYPTIFSSTDATKAINDVFEAELGRKATAAEMTELKPLLKAAQEKNPARYETRVVKGKKVVTQTTGLDVATFLTGQIKKNPTLKAEIDQRLGGRTSLTMQELNKTAIANGLDLAVFGDDINTWVKRVENGENIDIFKNLIRKTAKIGLPDKVGALLDEGVDLNAVYAPYKNLMARVLEIQPDAIKLDDPTLRAAIGPDKEMPIYEFERALRKDPRWQYTDTARQEVSDIALGVLQDFGFTG
jgi:DNA-binding ferritin-like protein (Dps family)